MTELGSASFELANKFLEDAERRDQNISVEVSREKNAAKMKF